MVIFHSYVKLPEGKGYHSLEMRPETGDFLLSSWLFSTASYAKVLI